MTARDVPHMLLHRKNKLTKQGYGKTGGQTAIEYMLLLAAVVALVLIGLRLYMSRFFTAADIYYNRAAKGIYGDPPR